MAEPIGDDESFERNLAKARAALGGRALRRTARPVSVDRREVAPPDPDARVGDRDARIAALEAENRRLRAALARIHRESTTALDR